MEYIIGNKPPPPYYDVGTAACDQSAPPTMQYIAFKSAILRALNTDTISVKFGVDAVRHMRHYMGNTGQDLQVNVQDLMQKSNILKFSFNHALFNAREFCQTLPLGVHEITTKECERDKFEPGNLTFAIGSYKFWGQGKASVNPRPDPDTRFCLLDFTFHFIDRYNWDEGKETPVGLGIKIRDHDMAEFQRQCLAQEYNIHGELKKQIVWDFRWR